LTDNIPENKRAYELAERPKISIAYAYMLKHKLEFERCRVLADSQRFVSMCH